MQGVVNAWYYGMFDMSKQSNPSTPLPGRLEPRLLPRNTQFLKLVQRQVGSDSYELPAKWPQPWHSSRLRPRKELQRAIVTRFQVIGGAADARRSCHASHLQRQDTISNASLEPMESKVFLCGKSLRDGYKADAWRHFRSESLRIPEQLDREDIQSIWSYLGLPSRSTHSTCLHAQLGPLRRKVLVWPSVRLFR